MAGRSQSLQLWRSCKVIQVRENWIRKSQFQHVMMWSSIWPLEQSHFPWRRIFFCLCVSWWLAARRACSPLKRRLLTVVWFGITLYLNEHGLQSTKGLVCFDKRVWRSYMGSPHDPLHSYQSDLHQIFSPGPAQGKKLQGTPDWSCSTWEMAGSGWNAWGHYRLWNFRLRYRLS